MRVVFVGGEGASGDAVVMRFMAVIILDDRTARVVARGSRELCVRVAAEYDVLETVVMPSRF